MIPVAGGVLIKGANGDTIGCISELNEIMVLVLLPLVIQTVP